MARDFKIIFKGAVKALNFLVIVSIMASCAKIEEQDEVRVSEGSKPLPGTETVTVPVVFKAYAEYMGTKASESDIAKILIPIYCDGALVENVSLGSKTTGSIDLVAGKTYRYYATANITRSSSLEESKESAVRMSISATEPTGGFPMAASEEFTVSADGTSEVEIMLQRLHSKIRFKLDKSDVEDLSITSVQIKQAASTVSLFSESAATATVNGDSATSTEISALNNGSEICLYVPENCQGILLPSSSNQQSKVPDNISGKAGLCSYLEAKGKFSGANELNGEIIYRFYLGQNTTNDFNVIRNTDNTVTLIPSRSGITADTWQVDVSDVYAKVTTMSFSNATGEVQYRDKTASQTVQTTRNLGWDKAIRTSDCYLAIGNLGSSSKTGYISRSYDGKTWTTVKTIIGGVTDIAYGGGKYVVATGGNLYTSSDAETWTFVSSSYKIKLLAYGLGKFYGINSNNAVYSSSNGSTWARVSGATVLSPSAFTMGDGALIAVGSNLKMSTSTNGKTWTTKTFTVDTNLSSGITGLVYGMGKYVMCTGTQIYYSDDAVSWKLAEIDGLNVFSCMAVDYKDGVFAACYTAIKNSKQYTGVATSIDGIHWVQTSLTSPNITPAAICIK